MQNGPTAQVGLTGFQGPQGSIGASPVAASPFRHRIRPYPISSYKPVVGYLCREAREITDCCEAMAEQGSLWPNPNLTYAAYRGQLAKVKGVVWVDVASNAYQEAVDCLSDARDALSELYDRSQQFPIRFGTTRDYLKDIAAIDTHLLHLAKLRLKLCTSTTSHLK